MDNSIKSVLKISGSSKMIVTKLPSNIKIYLVLKAYLNPVVSDIQNRSSYFDRTAP